MHTIKKIFIFTLLLFAAFEMARAQRDLGVRPTDSGGPLKFEQAVYDVRFYDLTLRVDPRSRSISGTSVMRAQI
ncbi:MAG: peptidase M1, partial [Blastocatellia bacterium]